MGRRPRHGAGHASGLHAARPRASRARHLRPPRAFSRRRGPGLDRRGSRRCSADEQTSGSGRVAPPPTASLSGSDGLWRRPPVDCGLLSSSSRFSRSLSTSGRVEIAVASGGGGDGRRKSDLRTPPRRCAAPRGRPRRSAVRPTRAGRRRAGAPSGRNAARSPRACRRAGPLLHADHDPPALDGSPGRRFAPGEGTPLAGALFDWHVGSVFSRHQERKQKKGPLCGPFLMAPRAGLEPATLRLTAGCSTIELPRTVRAV